MTSRVLFYTLCGLSSTGILIGLRRREGVFEFPVVFCAAFLFSIAPQMVNHVFYPGRLPAAVYEDHGVEYALVMCILCVMAGMWGYQVRVRQAGRMGAWVRHVDPRRLFWAGAVLGLIGLLGSMRIDSLAGGFEERFTGGGHYDMEWSGAPVRWTYVARLLPLGFVLSLNAVLLFGSFGRWIVTMALLLYPIMNVVFLGRRSMAIGLVAWVGVTFWFRRGWRPPRWVSLGAFACGAAVIVLAPYYRGYASRTGDVMAAAQQVDGTEALRAYAVGERGEGIDNLVVGLPARLRAGSYNLGSSFWNAAVEYLVPGQIIGKDVKEGLKLRLGLSDNEAYARYGVWRAYGSVSTGPYAAFSAFGFAGCLIFAALGRLYRVMWSLARGRGILSMQLVYVVTVVGVASSVVDSPATALPNYLLNGVIVMAVLRGLSFRVWKGAGGPLARGCERQALVGL